MKRAPRQLELRVRTWGGRRRGAGRKPAAGRRSTPHRRRPAHDPRCPAHVTLRTRSGLPTLRSDPVFSAVQRALARSSHASFRLLHYSVQCDHLHLLVEADTPTRLVRGAQGLAIRVARAINRVVRRRGRVWHGRYHAHVLRAPREVRNAFVYVLQNFRKHLRAVPGIDPRVVGALVRGMAKHPYGIFDQRAGRRTPHLARAGEMAATWAARRQGDAAKTLRVPPRPTRALAVRVTALRLDPR